MKRPIKFRGVVINRKAAVGKEADIGDIVTGSLIVYNDGSTPHCWIRRMEKNYADIDYPVDPDSVVQLVGYDSLGNEVYEGDEILRYDSFDEFEEAPENGVIRTVGGIDYENNMLNWGYYCFLRRAKSEQTN